jgi:FkbM family methyltransferase
MVMRLDLQTEKDYWLGTYEIDLQQAILQHVQAGWVAYDIGANIGYITLLLAKMVGENGQVIAFEALPANIRRLHENIRLNGLGSNVRVYPAAVAGHSGSIQFLVGPSGATGKAAGSAGRPENRLETIEVPAVALDDFVYLHKNPLPQLIKIDIEGGEILALPGMRRVVAEARPLLFLELHGPEAARVTWDVLSDAGYTLCRMNPDLPRVLSQVELNWKSYLVGLP